MSQAPEDQRNVRYSRPGVTPADNNAPAEQENPAPESVEMLKKRFEEGEDLSDEEMDILDEAGFFDGSDTGMTVDDNGAVGDEGLYDDDGVPVGMEEPIGEDADSHEDSGKSE